MKLAISNSKGKKVGETELRPEIAEVKVNEGVVHQVVRAQLAASRTGTTSTKTRSEVRGGGRKPWRQKGTGRARAGSIRSPLWVGGGAVFGPTPRDYSFSVPKKVKKQALRSIIASKAKDGKLIIVDDFGLAQPKTKAAVDVLKNLGALGKTTVIVGPEESVIIKSVRNIEGVRAIKAQNINAYDLLNNEKIVMTKPALELIQEVLGG